MSQNKIIYALYHPDAPDVPVYVGITNNIHLRLADHVSCPSQRLRPFIKRLKRDGRTPFIKEIDRGGVELERQYINKFIDAGHRLFNIYGSPASVKNRIKSGKGLDSVVIFKTTKKLKKDLISVAEKEYKRDISDFMRLVAEDIISGKITLSGVAKYDK